MVQAWYTLGTGYTLVTCLVRVVEHTIGTGSVRDTPLLHSWLGARFGTGHTLGTFHTHLQDQSIYLLELARVHAYMYNKVNGPKTARSQSLFLHQVHEL